MIYAGAGLLLFGLTMWTRGMIYTLSPGGKIAEKRKKKNLKYGFTTDMKLFGRKVRRLGFMIALVGGALCAWHFSGEPEASSTAAIPATALPETAPTP